MINKIIHYCWFGGNPLDEKGQKCLESWEKFFPDWKIVRWDENNFDVNKIDFMSKAYKAKKWAFVSDVARLLVVYENGGLYFDTDVEVIKPFDDLLSESKECFMGLEMGKYVASGLGFGAVKHHSFLELLIEEYKKLNFDDYSDNLGEIACPVVTTNLLKNYGFVSKDEKQTVMGIDIYPTEFFAPLDYKSGKLHLTKETLSIHWYGSSWQDENQKNEQKKLRRMRAVFGNKNGERLYGILSCIKKEGIAKYVSARLKKRNKKYGK